MTPAELSSLFERAERILQRLEALLPQPLAAPDWNAAIAWRYRRRAGGHGALHPVRHLAALRLDDLKGIDAQKEKLRRNTEQFLRGAPANNALLTGARGTGKSSLIRALLAAYAPQGLRLIEIDKGDMADLPDIVEIIAPRPEKFVLYCDDLSFDEGDIVEMSFTMNIQTRQMGYCLNLIQVKLVSNILLQSILTTMTISMRSF